MLRDAALTRPPADELGGLQNDALLTGLVVSPIHQALICSPAIYRRMSKQLNRPIKSAGDTHALLAALLSHHLVN